MTLPKKLAKDAFQLRFTRLQVDLHATLNDSIQAPEILLAAQDRLILRLEAWVDGMADLRILTKADEVMFRQILLANRKIYRVKVLALKNIAVSEEEAVAVNHALQLALQKITHARKSRSVVLKQ